MLEVLYAMEEAALQSYVSFKSDIDKLRSIATPDQIDKVKSAVQELQLSTGQFFTLDEESGIAQIPIMGTLTPKAEICVSLTDGSQTIYSSIVEAISKAEMLPSVKEIHFIFDTPGGYVSGVDSAAIAIKNSKKPTKAIVVGMACSAGYWLASQCDEIIAATPLAQVGSIGVLVEVIDRSKMDEDNGIKRYVLTSENAPEKFPDVGTKAGRDKVIKRLTDIEKVFISRVAEGRGVSSDEVKEKYGRGAVLIASDAISAGMIDSVKEKVFFDDTSKDREDDDMFSSSGNDFSPAATPGKVNKKKEEGKNMPTLKELLAQNPGAMEEYNNSLSAAEKKGEEKITARIDAAKNYIANKDYPTVSSIALDVITGKVESSVLTATVAAIDHVKQSQASSAAADETNKNGDTPPETEKNKREDGICETEEDFQAELERLKNK